MEIGETDKSNPEPKERKGIEGDILRPSRGEIIIKFKPREK